MPDLIHTAVKRLTGGDKKDTPIGQLHEIARKARAAVGDAVANRVGRPLARVAARLTGRDPRRVMSRGQLRAQRRARRDRSSIRRNTR